jgi:hypothetical protein
MQFGNAGRAALAWTGRISGAECGGGVGESATLDPADLPTALDVTVAEATGYTVHVYGRPAVQVSG